MHSHPFFSESPWQGKASDFKNYDLYPWMKSLSHRSDIFCVFTADWYHNELPPGFDYYIITFHIEQVNVEWIKKQQVDGKLIVLFPGRHYDLEIPNVVFIGYTQLHNDLNKMIKWHGIQHTSSNKKYKFSNICNRVTQSKLWLTTQILESEENSLVIHNPDYILNQNVHSWTPTGVQYLDRLTEIYKEKYITLHLSDGFDQEIGKCQRYNSNPWQPYYTNTAIHVVGGSFHYSYMQDGESNTGYIYPGPDIDEKTLKCLLAGIPFLPGAQFEVYDYLSTFGLNFDYGFDTSFDSDPGNLTRFEKLCKLIDELSNWSIADIVSATEKSSLYNQKHILTGNFAEACNKYNQQQIEKIFQALE